MFLSLAVKTFPRLFKVIRLPVSWRKVILVNLYHSLFLFWRPQFTVFMLEITQLVWIQIMQVTFFFCHTVFHICFINVLLYLLNILIDLGKIVIFISWDSERLLFCVNFFDGQIGSDYSLRSIKGITSFSEDWLSSALLVATVVAQELVD